MIQVINIRDMNIKNTLFFYSHIPPHACPKKDAKQMTFMIIILTLCQSYPKCDQSYPI